MSGLIESATAKIGAVVGLIAGVVALGTTLYGFFDDGIEEFDGSWVIAVRVNNPRSTLYHGSIHTWNANVVDRSDSALAGDAEKICVNLEKINFLCERPLKLTFTNKKTDVGSAFEVSFRHTTYKSKTQEITTNGVFYLREASLNGVRYFRGQLLSTASSSRDDALWMRQVDAGKISADIGKHPQCFDVFKWAGWTLQTRN